MRKIPIRRTFSIEGDKDEYRPISYRNEIFIILLDENGNIGNYQYSGTDCLQGIVKGFIYKSFKSKLKYFKTKTWDKKTCWGSKYPSKLYFTGIKEVDKIGYSFPEFNSNFKYNKDFTEIIGLNENGKTWKEVQDEHYEKVYKKVDPYCKSSELILNIILSEVIIKTRIGFELDFENTDYGIHWFEAHIPLKYKDKKYLLTWMNCD